MFDWKPEYNSGISEIDKQHKKLFALADELYDIANRRDGFDYHDEIIRVFDELSDYTVYHFQYEEALMKQAGYGFQELVAHCAEHEKFVQKIKKIAQQDLDGKQTQVLLDIIMFAVDWIEKHILGSDRKYAQYYTQKKR